VYPRICHLLRCAYPSNVHGYAKRFLPRPASRFSRRLTPFAAASMLTCTSRSRALGADALTCSAVFSCLLALAHAVLSAVPRVLWPWSRSACPCPLVSNAANVREHAWGDGSGMRCAGACSGKVTVLEAAAQVSSLGLMSPTAAAYAARVLAAAASPAPAPFACAVFLVTCVFGDAAVDERGEGGCRS
jgi:hypothetical protein